MMSLWFGQRKRTEVVKTHRAGGNSVVNAFMESDSQLDIFEFMLRSSLNSVSASPSRRYLRVAGGGLHLTSSILLGLITSVLYALFQSAVGQRQNRQPFAKKSASKITPTE